LDVGVAVRSAAAGEDVGPGAEAPRAGPLGCSELAAADLGTAALALLDAATFNMLGRFAARHGMSLSRVIGEVEFFAFGFLVALGPSSASPKNLRQVADLR
jgi:hypothetical protein